MTIAESERITRLVDCAMTIDAEGRIASADDGLDHLLGLRSSEVRGRPLSALVHPADLHETMAVLERHRTSPDHRERSMVLRCKHRDGSWRACEAPIRTASDLSGGVIIGLRGLGKSDPPIALTEAVDELATRSGIATRYDCVMIVDRNGIINLVEDRVNSALGHDPDDVVGHGIWSTSIQTRLRRQQRRSLVKLPRQTTENRPTSFGAVTPTEHGAGAKSRGATASTNRRYEELSSA